MQSIILSFKLFAEAFIFITFELYEIFFFDSTRNVYLKLYLLNFSLISCFRILFLSVLLSTIFIYLLYPTVNVNLSNLDIERFILCVPTSDLFSTTNKALWPVIRSNSRQLNNIFRDSMC